MKSEKYMIEREGPDGIQWYAEDAPGRWTSNWRQGDLFTYVDAFDSCEYAEGVKIRKLSDVEVEQRSTGHRL